MPLLDEMIANMNRRIATAAKPYRQLIYFADVHFDAAGDNAGFEKVLSQIAAQEADDTLCVVIGGDLVDKGTDANYGGTITNRSGFIDRVRRFYQETGIPVIPGMGNHEFYGVSPKGTEIDRYRQKIGRVNFPVEISSKGLPKSLTLVAFNDAKPRKPVKISIQDRSNNCKTISRDYHVFYFRDNYIHLDPMAPEKFSHFPDYLNNAQGERIVVFMHVPPRKNPLARDLDSFIQQEFAHCASVNHVITMAGLKAYYRDLWMLVHGNSPYSFDLDSTQMLVDEIKNRNKVDLLLAGHVHTYYAFPLEEANHPLDIVISGGGGNSSARSYFSNFPVTKYQYLRILYSADQGRYIYEKVDAGN